MIRIKEQTKEEKLIYPELSYQLVGVFFAVHNALGRYARELQYCNELETQLKALKISYKREFSEPGTGNRVDFIIDDKIIVEIKAKPIISKADYFQTQRYLQSLNIRLGLLVNFQARYVKPIRVLRIDTDARKRYLSHPSH
jgi:GxxExxY protein